MRQINDALGRFNSTLVYVYLSVTLGKDRHIHIRIYASAHGHWQCQWTENEIETEETALERRRKLARECYRIFQVEGEGFCCSLYKQATTDE